MSRKKYIIIIKEINKYSYYSVLGIGDGKRNFVIKSTMVRIKK
jgi:hypothetical protein